MLARPVYAAPLVLAFASAAGLLLALLEGEYRLSVYFAFWLASTLALALAEWRGALLGFTLASLALGTLVMLLGLSTVFKVSTAAMMAFLAYMVYRSLSR